MKLNSFYLDSTNEKPDPIEWGLLAGLCLLNNDANQLASASERAIIETFQVCVTTME